MKTDFDWAKEELLTEKVIEGTCGISCYRYIKEKNISLQFCGFEIVLLPDGTYFLNDTTGG